MATDFSDPLIISITIGDMFMLMMNFRQGMKQLLGERSFMQMHEAKKSYDGPQMSVIYDQEIQKSLAVYERLEALVEEWQKNHPMNSSNDDEEEPFSVLVDKAIEEVSTEEYISEEHDTQPGDKMQYVGKLCGLIPGRIYTIDAVSKQDAGTFFVIARDNNGHYRSEDFLYAPEFRKTYRVRYLGTNDHFDQGVGDERLFEIHDIQNWSGTPYLVIMTSDAQALSYPQAEFELLEDGVD
jgi:hypothetical protein